MEETNEGNSILSEYLSKAELAAQLHRTIRSIDRWALTGDGPPYTRIGKMTLYRRESVIAWLRSRERVPPRPNRKRGGAR